MGLKIYTGSLLVTTQLPKRRNETERMSEEDIVGWYQRRFHLKWLGAKSKKKWRKNVCAQLPDVQKRLIQENQKTELLQAFNTMLAAV